MIGDDVVPIPGTKNPSRIEENAGAVNVKLTVEDLMHIEELIPKIVGERYDPKFSSNSFNNRL